MRALSVTNGVVRVDRSNLGVRIDEKCRESSFELESLQGFVLYRPGVSARIRGGKIKIESRSRRVLTIPGRLSSDLQAIVNPSYPRCRLFVSLSSQNPRLSVVSPSLVSLRSLPRALARGHPLTPRASRFLNPHRFRPCPLEFESTLQNRGVTKRSYVSLLPRRATKGVRVLVPSLSNTRANRSTQERASREMERIFRATCHRNMFLVAFLRYLLPFAPSATCLPLPRSLSRNDFLQKLEREGNRKQQLLDRLRILDLIQFISLCVFRFGMCTGRAGNSQYSRAGGDSTSRNKKQNLV